MFNKNDQLKAQAFSLEEEFFRKQDHKLTEQLKIIKKMKETKEALSQISGITDDAVLQKLVELDIHPEIAASISLVPLIEVAWADGNINEEEKKAILNSVNSAGFIKNSINYELINQWLTHKPDPKLLEAWVHYIQGLCIELSETERLALKNEILGHTRSVAEASGGLLGIGSVSKEEKAVLNRLEKAFT